MNEYQWTMWEDLMYLVEHNEAFYYKDFEFSGAVYRIFNYRLASYTDFCNPNAQECRGHTFEVDKMGPAARPIRLASLPMEKFWNVDENPMVMNLDFNNPQQIMIKEDGSLISSFLHVNSIMENVLHCKSKGSLFSDQAIDSHQYLMLLRNRDLYDDIFRLEERGFTVNMEYTAPHNRIVIGYEHERLVVLNVRDRWSGNYLLKDQLNEYPALLAHWVEEYQFNDDDLAIIDTNGMEAWVESVKDMNDIEGFVIRLANGQYVKKKTLWYLALHHTKDSVNNPRRLFEAILEETSDDLRTMFADDPLVMQQIADMEQKVEKLYNHMVNQVETFYDENNRLDRKDYAILAQRKLDRMYLGLAMNKFIGRENDYKAFLKSKWKVLGFKDENPHQLKSETQK